MVKCETFKINDEIKDILSVLNSFLPSVSSPQFNAELDIISPLECSTSTVTLQESGTVIQHKQKESNNLLNKPKVYIFASELYFSEIAFASTY